MSDGATLWAPQAWIDGRWQSSVLLDIDNQGRWGHIAVGVAQ